MEKKGYNDISPEKLGMLAEAGNIGAGHAVTALSQLLGEGVAMSIAEVKVKRFEDISNLLGNEENNIAAMLIEVTGDLKGFLILLLEPESAHKLVGKILQKDSPLDKDFDPLEQSVLCETGNILAGSYLSALSTLLGNSLVASVPQMAVDMAGAILSFSAISLAADASEIIVIETAFQDAGKLLNGTYLLMMDSEAYTSLITSIGALL